uniref:G_PROTEIN_RECEP_F1_2 domain-containing protein n=1 Tax=Caenorhabditis tropicalis TaxID=1561998 RepID=A0A1I7TW15_9PELO
MLIHGNCHLIFHVICIIYYLYIAPNKAISRETRRNQQRFFVGIVLQTAIPSILIIFAAGFFIFDNFTHNMTQKAMNIICVAVGFHGVLEALMILLVHRSYRDAVLKMMRRREDESEFIFTKV